MVKVLLVWRKILAFQELKPKQSSTDISSANAVVKALLNEMTFVDVRSIIGL